MTEYILMAVSIGLAVAGILAGRILYLRRREVGEDWQKRFARLYRRLWNKNYVDELYKAVIVRPTVNLSERLLWKWFDVGIIDGFVNGSAALTAKLGEWIRRMQTGVAQAYATVFLAGILLVVTWLLFR
ncbi:MAG: hypothetical protein HBSIN02_23590 [Bacteroidia bacterium]|nr:MAG: hypothetical protein HBSIN02_23590 [Bacteroidia bacterium]